mmetsp:Transcript_18907/g.29596  ORF Transcript_18907/g.29596 Transcript_18907/m.29596 type:complete len:89 (-) Transcript_18907:137-403(-)
MSSIEYCLTPEQAHTDNHHMLPCPPPPPQVGLHQDLPTDTTHGFYLAAPCNSSSIATTDQKVQFGENPIKLLPKQSSYRFGDTSRPFS